MSGISAATSSLAAWLLVAFCAGFAVAWLMRELSARRRGSARDVVGSAALRDRLERVEKRAASLADTARHRRSRIRSMRDRIKELTRQLEQVQARKPDPVAPVAADVLARRVRDIAQRDRTELIRLQEELEADQRVGMEKARLIRTYAALSEAQPLQLETAIRTAVHTSEARVERLRVSVAALRAALTHAQRSQAGSEALSAQLRAQLRARPHALTVEVPVEVPVGFTAFPTYSENRPSSP